MCIRLCKTFVIKAKDGKEIVLRRPKITDVNQLLYHINSLVEEDAMILTNEKKTLREEKQWLKDQIKQIKKNKLHQLIAEYNGKIIGNVEIKKGR